MKSIAKLCWLMCVFSFGIISCNNDDKSVKDKVQELRNKPSYPFDTAATIEIFSYKSKYDTENSFSDFLEQNISKSKRTKAIFDNNQLQIKERVKLKPEEVIKLTEILYHQPCSDEIVGNCFTPRHALVFFDKAGDPFAYTEICLECSNASFSAGFSKFQLCQSKVDSLTNMFSKLGITYFQEPIL